MSGKFTLEIELGNAEMRTPEHIAAELRVLADQIEETPVDHGSITEVNGNTVGKFTMALPEEEAEFGEIWWASFTKDDEGEFPDYAKPLHEFERGSLIEDAEGRLFNVVGNGPVQGSVEVVDDDEVHAYLDVAERFRLHARS